MKVHWVELENWRQHTKTRIDFDDATTVVYGPNWTGKSTIFEALSRGFFDKSSSHARAIKRIKPLAVSGNVTSTVRIEFTLNKIKYRVEKNFNLRRGTILYKIVDEKTILIDQDESADEQLIQLLEADLPSTRGSKPSHWGAFHWLWVPQENRELPTDKEGDPTTSLHLETKEGGGVLVTPKFEEVQNSVRNYYAKYFTRTGKTIKDSPISKIEEEIQTLQHRCVELGDKIKRVDDEKHQLEELEKELPTLDRKFNETNEELKKARDEAIDFSSIESKLEASKVGVNEAERDVQEAKKAVNELKKSEEKIEKLQKDEQEVRENLSRLDALCEQLEKRLQEKIEIVEDKAMKIRESEELTRDARILWTESDTMKKIEEIKKKIERIEDIDKKIEDLRKEEVPIVPTDKEIDNLIKSQTQIKVLKESLKARGLAVNVKPGKKGSLDVEVDGEKIKDEKLTATGTESVNVGAPGLGKVTIKAKLEKAHDAKVDIDRLKRGIQEVLSKYDVKSIDELKELNKIQKEISNKIKEWIAERRGVDKRSFGEITFELKKLEEKCEKYKKIKRTPNAIKLNPTDIDLGKLVNKREKEEVEVRSALDNARAERDELNKELGEKKEELAGIRTENKHIYGELNNARNQEREIIRQYGSVENQEKILKNAEAKSKKRTKEYEEIKQQYEELKKGPINRIKRLEREIKHQEQLIRQQRTSIDQLKGRISTGSLDGTYSKLAETESYMEILSERIEKEQIRAESYKLLKEALEKQYSSALLVVVGPIRKEVKRSLGYVTGFLYDDVELNEHLFPIQLGERGFEDVSLEFNDASSGLKEILALCIRLAVAKHLSERDSQCLVLDDPFVHVSSDNSSKMIELINEAIKDCGLQIIIFTHRPMELSGFTGKMIDIQSVK